MPRLGNKKSRKGCARCKLRKVKCDEQLPRCGWCESHSLPCEYTGTPVAAEERRRVATSHATPGCSVSPDERHSSSFSTSVSPSWKTRQTSEQTSLTSVEAARWHALELGLLQYYIAIVAPAFPYVRSHAGINIHADLIPQEALRCPCLLHAMFAYALLHMHMQKVAYGKYPRNCSYFEGLGLQIKPLSFQSSTPISDDSRTSDAPFFGDLLSLHRHYFDQALQEQRAAVADFNAQNADGVCLAAILVAMIALIHASQVEPSRQLPDAPYLLPLEWFYLQRSFVPCLQAARPILTMDSATNIIIHSGPHIDYHNLGPPKPGPFYQLLTWQPKGNPEHLNAETEAAYSKAVAYVQSLYKYIMDKEPWEAIGRRILAFPTVAPERYVQLLEDAKPRALVILATMLAFGKKIDPLWWIFMGVADHHVRGIAKHVPQEWQWAMTWPLEVLEIGVEAVEPPT